MANIARATGLPNKSDLTDNPTDVEVMIDNALSAVDTEDDLTVDLGPAGPMSATPMAFDGNLTDLLDEGRLTQLAHEVINLAEDDDASRGDWKKTYANGLKVKALPAPEPHKRLE